MTQREASSGEPEVVREAARRRANFSPWNLLLVIPLIGVLIPAFYNKTDPTLGDMPFFYWYQLLWVFICAALVVGAHRLVRQHEERKREEVGLGRHRDETGGDR